MLHIEALSPTNVELKLPSHWRMHRVVHIEMLKRSHEIDTDDTPNQVLKQVDLPQVDDTEYEVEKILDKRVFGRKHLVTKYLVRWKGYTAEQDTWEPLTKLKNAQESIDEYERTQSTQPQNTDNIPTHTSSQPAEEHTPPESTYALRKRKPVVYGNCCSLEAAIHSVPLEMRSHKTVSQIHKLAFRHSIFEHKVYPWIQ